MPVARAQEQAARAENTGDVGTQPPHRAPPNRALVLKSAGRRRMTANEEHVGRVWQLFKTAKSVS